MFVFIIGTRLVTTGSTLDSNQITHYKFIYFRFLATMPRFLDSLRRRSSLAVRSRCISLGSLRLGPTVRDDP